MSFAVSGLEDVPVRGLPIAVLEPDPVSARLAVSALSGLGDVRQAVDPEGVIGCALAVVGFDTDITTIADLRLSGFDGPILALSARASVAVAVAAMRAGADDVAPKPITHHELVRRTQALMDSAPHHVTAPGSCNFEGFIGRSAQMRDIFDQIDRIAPSRAPVFVTGESGTGKEVAADAIHARSGRTRGRLVALNCAAIPRDLMESEIFGHVKGAFTGATEDRTGAAQLADGGTLFLDEVCEMDLALQAKLLRLIQTGEVRPVGGGRSRIVDVRFVCATNRDPVAEVASGRFREDLYYRLCVLPIHLPPLRDRGEDIMSLARAFLQRCAVEEGRAFNDFDTAAEALIRAYDWPGNVRQLQNVIRRLVVMNHGTTATAAMLPLALAHGSTPRAAAAPAQPDTIEPFAVQERRIIEEAIARCHGNLTKAAQALGIAPSTIYRKRESWATDAA